jgi:two-component system phosphate regulon response regulator PhoB
MIYLSLFFARIGGREMGRFINMLAAHEGSDLHALSGQGILKPLVVICSEDAEFYLILDHILGVDGFVSKLAGSADEAHRLTTEEVSHAVILDCQSDSKLSAPAVCMRLKQDPGTHAIPVVALIAAGAESQHIALLRAGVNESFMRPLAPAKLLDYLRSLLPATRSPSDTMAKHALTFGDIEMRLDSHRVHRNGKEIHLGSIEFRILRELLENPGRVFSREELISAVWPDNVHVSARTVDVHISRLRRSLLMVSERDVIRTVRSAGYSIEDERSD